MTRLLAALLAPMLAGACGPGEAPPETRTPESPAVLSTSSGPSPSPLPTPSPSPTTTPASLEDARSTGEALAAAEIGIRSADTPSASMEQLGRLQQAAYRKLVANPSWQAEALAQLPADLVPVARANIAAGGELRALTRPQESLPEWRIVAPPPPEELLGYYREAEAQFGVRWEYLAAIHLVETRMGRIRGLSPAGAQGPMQFIPSTWAVYGRGDINDPRDAILAAGRYLRAAGAPGDMDRALHAYNPTPRYVRAISSYAEQMIAEERAYLGYYHWQVFYRTVDGDVELSVGYGR